MFVLICRRPFARTMSVESHAEETADDRGHCRGVQEDCLNRDAVIGLALSWPFLLLLLWGEDFRFFFFLKFHKA